MAVRIRLARFGCRNKPFYRVVAINSSNRRDGKHVELLGYYDPLPANDDPKRIGLKIDRIKYWLSVGAQPSDPVRDILFMKGVLPLQPVVADHKGGSGDSHPHKAPNGNENDASEGVTNSVKLGDKSHLWCKIGVQFSETDFNYNEDIQDSSLQL
uniref:Plastid ribosomal protein S16 n=1 Tax=Pulsatilla cernua var. koreana TaxID=387930 RepID=A0A7L8Y956_9MAGN|nr:plastid ribosomal protein S16 [Pulsatilla cernua var. koreana]